VARIRSIKPDTFTSETLASVPIEARWTFAGLWTYVDDEGRGKADARLIKAALYPLDDIITAATVSAHVDHLERAGVVCRYSVEGRTWLHVVNFQEHQHPNRPQGSKLPACPRDLHGVSTHEQCSEPAVNAPPQPTPVVVVVEEKEGSSRGEGESGEHAAGERLCEHLAARIEANGSRRPAITAAWRREARLLIERDIRAADEAHRLIDWCQSEAFWKANILGMPKFREKYDQLRLQATSRAGPTGGRHAPFRNPSDQSVYDEPLEAS